VVVGAGSTAGAAVGGVEPGLTSGNRRVTHYPARMPRRLEGVRASYGHHHGHSHRFDGGPTARRAHRLILAVLIPVAVLTVVGMVLLWPAQRAVPDRADGPERLSARVVTVDEVPCPAQPDIPGAPGPTVCGTVTVTVTEGAETGRRITTDIPNGPGAVTVAPGDRVVLLRLDDAMTGGELYAIVDHQRSGALWLLGVAFALAVVAFGRWRGLSALAGLGLTFAVLLIFVVPAILAGSPPVAVAVVGATAIMLTVLYLTHGFNLTTTVAVAGTLASLTVTAVLSGVATATAHLSGVADETSSYLTITQGEVNMRGLLLAGIVIGSLGVLDDVTVTQSATVAELARANPAYGFRQLYRAATRVGRAHIASVINTIVLAYAGASLPLMLLFAAGSTPVGELLTGELLAQEIVRSAVGTLGLIAAVPITTALAAALVVRRSPGQAEASDGDEPVVPAPATRGPDAAALSSDPWMAFVERDRR
jgi:uncharacterized membrane protein